jgi:hypothetical protein
MNLEPFISQLTILDKNVRLKKLELNWAQREYMNIVQHQFETTGVVRLIVLKARQLGLSTLTEACAYTLSFIFDHYSSLIVAHEADASRNLLKMTKRYDQYAPWKDLYTLKHNTRNDLEWEETKSSIKVSTAGKKTQAGVGRSSTNHFIHASEVAFWPDAEVVWNGLSQTVPRSPGTFVCFESTANGTGNFFHHMWEEAEAGENDYFPLFLPWWRHPEYTADHANLPLYPLGHLDDAENELIALLKTNGTDDESHQRIIWRRWATKNLCNNDNLQFMQEYPATAEEAFISSGMNVFPHESLKNCFERAAGFTGYLFRDGSEITFKADPHGPLKLFLKPSPGAHYVIGGDPTRTTRGDYACAQIINRDTKEQVGIWRGKTSPGTFGEELYKLGRFFNDALMVTEIQGPGTTTLGMLMGLDYPNLYRRVRNDKTRQAADKPYGWSTTTLSKELAIGWLLQHIVNTELTIHDHHTFMEMRDYVTLDRGGYGPADEHNGHDDTVMSLAIALTGHETSSPTPAITSDALISEMNGEIATDPYTYNPYDGNT